MKTVYSKHAQERINFRRLTHHDIELTLINPDKVLPSGDNQHKYIKNINGRKYHVVAKNIPEQNVRLIISAWVRGEDDRESLLTTVLLAPFRILWDISRWLWKKTRSRQSKRRR